jgi:hypothetical protein
MRHHAQADDLARRPTARWPVLLLGLLMLGALVACGQSSTVAVTPTETTAPTATLAPTDTATVAPTATETLAHMIVRVTPDPSRCGTSCATYTCTPPGGASCNELLFCSGSPAVTSFPFFEVDNSGQVPLTWSWTIVPMGTGTGMATLTLAPNGGTVAGGAAVAVTLKADKSLASNGPAAFNINFTGGGATTTVQASCSNG